MVDGRKKSETYQRLRVGSSRIDGVHSTDTAMDLAAVCRLGMCMTTSQCWSHEEEEDQ